MNKQHTTQQINLIALWAFCESGLGGLLHAVRLPFTGFIVGGFACIVLMLLSVFLRHKPYQIIQATLIVMAIKFAVSPHAPLPAYIAVSFQGLLAYFLFGVFGRNILTCLLFGGLAMLESALQKFLLATLLYGKSLWEAIDGLAIAIAKEFKLSGNFSASYYLIFIYSGIYLIWGLFLGWKGFFLPQKLEGLFQQLPKLEVNANDSVQAKTKGPKAKWVGLVIILLFISISFWLSEGSMSKGLYTVIRTMVILLLLYLGLIPLLRYGLNRLLDKSKNDHLFKQVNLQMAVASQQSKQAWHYASLQSKGIKRLWLFMEVLLALTMYTNEQNAKDTK